VKAMHQITSAVVGITLVLVAVFVPMAFFPGSTGGIYRQFSVTLAVSIAFSALMALTLTPALCATLLRAEDVHRDWSGNPLSRAAGRFFDGFNGWFARTSTRYQSVVGRILVRPLRFLVIYVALFAVTCGEGVRERAAAAKERGDYLRSHALQALAIESAEALAEWLHARLRTLWGFPDPSELSIADKLKAHYRGLRVSFGYPACPDLADQATLWRLLRPEEVGIALTEGFMMDPEASVSALVFHHPAAKYFKAGD